MLQQLFRILPSSASLTKKPKNLWLLLMVTLMTSNCTYDTTVSAKATKANDGKSVKLTSSLTSVDEIRGVYTTKNEGSITLYTDPQFEGQKPAFTASDGTAFYDARRGTSFLSYVSYVTDDATGANSTDLLNTYKFSDTIDDPTGANSAATDITTILENAVETAFSAHTAQSTQQSKPTSPSGPGTL